MIAEAGLLNPEAMNRLPASSMRGLIVDPGAEPIVALESPLSELGRLIAGFMDMLPPLLVGSPDALSINSAWPSGLLDIGAIEPARLARPEGPDKEVRLRAAMVPMLGLRPSPPVEAIDDAREWRD